MSTSPNVPKGRSEDTHYYLPSTFTHIKNDRTTSTHKNPYCPAQTRKTPIWGSFKCYTVKKNKKNIGFSI